jgi:hypothetical protein
MVVTTRHSLLITGRSSFVVIMLNYYLTQIKISIIAQFQYRAANWFYFISMLAEPIIYLVVWSTVTRQGSGAVAGYTAGEFAAYYIVWTLVRQMNIVLRLAQLQRRVGITNDQRPTTNVNSVTFNLLAFQRSTLSLQACAQRRLNPTHPW